jgi:histone deacetylase 11
MPRVVYSPHYNIGFCGLERLHPFDSRKYGRAWRCLRRHFGAGLNQIAVRPSRPIRRDELLAVHEALYLDQLRQSKYVACALELPPLRHLPHWVIDRQVLRPMRWATMGTVIAAREALQHGFAVNLGGGYHHARPDCGEGFCIYSDIALAIHSLRNDRPLAADARIAYIDLDAHQGNGVCHSFMRDNSVFIFDIYNSTIYPCYDVRAQQRVDCDVRLTSACDEREYLNELQRMLPVFLDSITRSESIKCAIYNAGTDVFTDDPLGGLNLTANGILRRDLYTVRELRRRGIPTLMLLSGGYTSVSYQLVANSVIRLLETELDRDPFTDGLPGP